MKSSKDNRQSDRSQGGNNSKPTIEVLATPGRGADRPQEIKYTDTKIIGNGSFGVVYQAVLIKNDNQEEVIAIKKVPHRLNEYHRIFILWFRCFKIKDSKIENCRL